LPTPYLAQGEDDACGSGCNEWIAAEGRFDDGSPQRLRAFLNRHSGRKLPIFFSSPGGSVTQALAIGRLMRERGMTAGVARTVPQGCAPTSDDEACRTLKHSGKGYEISVISKGKTSRLSSATPRESWTVSQALWPNSCNSRLMSLSAEL
jgi:hypothetical protein